MAYFIETLLRADLKKMMCTKAVPDGLEPHECEHGSRQNKPPFHFIPENDDLQENVESTTFTLSSHFLTKWSWESPVCPALPASYQCHQAEWPHSSLSEACRDQERLQKQAQRCLCDPQIFTRKQYDSLQAKAVKAATGVNERVKEVKPLIVEKLFWL